MASPSSRSITIISHMKAHKISKGPQKGFFLRILRKHLLGVERAFYIILHIFFVFFFMVSSPFFCGPNMYLGDQ